MQQPRQDQDRETLLSLKASSGGITPSMSPSGPITLTSLARILSFLRIKLRIGGRRLFPLGFLTMWLYV